MTPVTKQAWIDALRSGEFKQTTGALAKAAEDGSVCYCCLGVLAKLAGAEMKPSGDELEFDFCGSIESGVIPLSFRHTIVLDMDLTQEVPTIDRSDTTDLMRRLSTLNDRGATFGAVANYLEEL